MKKVLFATTAVVAFSVAGAAQAQIELGLGGYWQEWVGIVDQDADEEDWDQQSDKEIHIKGSTTLDNGITVGVRAELEVGQAIDAGGKAHDEAVLSISGGFGTLLLGNEDNGANLLHVSAPSVGVGLQDGDVVDGDWVEDHWGTADNNAPNATVIYDNDDANKVTYVLPTFSGFTAGVSLIPDVGGDQADANVPSDADGVPAYGVAAQYANDFEAASVKASVGYAWADDNTTDLEYLSAGLQVGFGGFTVGGSYYNMENNAPAAGDTFDEGTAWEVGASYGQGPWVASIGYFTSDVDAAPGQTDDSERDVFQVDFSYNLGPGVDWKSTIASADFTDENGDENDGWAAITGFNLAF